MDHTGKYGPAWTESEVYLVSSNMYCDASPFGAFSHEWKVSTKTPKKERLDNRPCMLFYMRSLFAVYMMTGKSVRDNAQITEMIGNIVTKTGTNTTILFNYK